MQAAIRELQVCFCYFASKFLSQKGNEFFIGEGQKQKKEKRKKDMFISQMKRIDLIETCIWNDMDDINVNIEE